ncbi:MAG: ATP-binding domain-containing protein, partial [Paraclostridium sp.]
ITNGLQGFVLTRPDLSEMATTGNFIIDVKPSTPCTTYFMGLDIDYEFFSQGCTSEKTINPYNHGQKIEFGYAITCHMSQGSQYDKVLIYEEVLNRELHKKWMYTAITRGVKEVIIVKPNVGKKKTLPATGKSTYTKRRW